MAQAPDILGFLNQRKQSTTQGLQNLGNSVAGILKQKAQKEKLEQTKVDQLQAAEWLGQAAQGGEGSEELFTKAFQLAPRFTTGLMQTQKLRREATGVGSGAAKVGSQEILEDGTIIQSTASGPVVYNPEGVQVTGSDAAAAIQTARAVKVANLREAAGEKKRATLEAQGELEGEVNAGIISQEEAAKASIAAFDKIEAISQTMASYDEAIALIDEGADTGVIESKFPSMKAASIKLDNLQNRLGLDVVANTTFGALSAGELSLAMSTALPKGLDGPELRSWLLDKKASQEKMADYLESAAIYLGTPGNTKVGWLKKKKLEKQGGGAPSTDSNLQAPSKAIDYLKANPDFAGQFKAKFGYLPEGF